MNANRICRLMPVAVLACCMAVPAFAKLPESPVDPVKAQEAAKKKAELAKKDAEALARAQDRVVAHYKKQLQARDANTQSGEEARERVAHAGPRGRLEKLACKLGTEDQHARIAVELVGGRVKSFAYYSKWKPRTCSVYIVRDDAWSRWVDAGNVTRITLNEEKGAFQIDHAPRSVKFVFRGVDRERFCGMEGKISGSLTVTRGKSQCELQGIMDQGQDIMRASAS